LHSDDFIDYATLSLTYVRYSNTNRYGWMSRLFYSVAGHGVVPWIMMIGGSASSSTRAKERGAPSPIQIVRTSGEFTQVKG